MNTANPIKIPMPEGAYDATWRRRGDDYVIDVPGGIVHNGKGEELHDLGLDASFRVSGPTLMDALVNFTEGVMRRRRLYGPPEGVITRPVSLKEAIEIHGDRRLSAGDRI